MSRPVLLRPCPRAGCGNPLNASEIVCTVDFHALATACYGKKRLGEPEAAMIEGRGRGLAYRCALCRQWHNGRGSAADQREEFAALLSATVNALQTDRRVGWRGLINLADAWRPGVSESSDRLDQTLAYPLA